MTKTAESKSKRKKERRNKRGGVIVIGSSGGGTATLGHTNPVELLRCIHEELGRVVAFPSTNTSTATATATATAADSNTNSNDNSSTSSYFGIQHALFVSLQSGKGLDEVSAATSSPLSPSLSTQNGQDGTDWMATLYAVGCSDENEVHENNDNDDLQQSSALLQVRAVCTGPLSQINTKCRQLDEKYLARSILHDTDNIQGIISISSDPLGVNSSSIQAAGYKGIPFTGSGGTSLSIALTKYHVNLCGNAGGSVATTTYTRAVSYVYALSKAWNMKYIPFSACDSNNVNNDGGGIVKHKPKMGSVFDACLPAFLCVCITCRVLEWILQNEQICHDATTTSTTTMEEETNAFAIRIVGKNMIQQHCTNVIPTLLYHLQHTTLPIVCGVVTAMSYAPQHESSVVMAAAIAASAAVATSASSSSSSWVIGGVDGDYGDCRNDGGSVLCGLLAGQMVAYLVGHTLFACIQWNIPATMTNIITAGGVGSIVALILHCFQIKTVLSMCTGYIRYMVRSNLFLALVVPSSSSFSSFFINNNTRLQWDGTGYGFLIGCLFCYGSKVGWYHSIFLPIILIEMEHGEGSIWGAVDECTLVLVSAGTCAANLCFLMIVTIMEKKGWWIHRVRNEKVMMEGMSENGPSGDNNVLSSSDVAVEGLNSSTCIPSVPFTTDADAKAGSGGGDWDISWRGLRINLLCGDFIEAAYPFMERSRIINISGYLASGVATEILYRKKHPRDVLSSAYLPIMVSVGMTKDWQRMALASFAAFGIAFVGTLVGNFITRQVEVRRNDAKEKMS